jgi:hypothetical protein
MYCWFVTSDRDLSLGARGVYRPAGARLQCFYLLTSWWYCQMSAPQQPMAPFILLLPFLIQPILLGIYAKKAHRRIGIIWGILALAMDIAITTFFETHMAAQLTADAAKEVGTVIISDASAEIGIAIIISTMVTLAILVMLRNGPQAKAGEDLPINLQRGLLRIWALISVSWIIFCAIEFLQNCTSRYACVFSASEHSPIYFDIGKWLIGFPALVFVIGLAACWVVEGFRRSAPN